MKSPWAAAVVGLLTGAAVAAVPSSDETKLSLTYEPQAPPRETGTLAGAGGGTQAPLGWEMADRRMLTLVMSEKAAAPAEDDADELAKKLSNPVANLISVPLQYNADFNAGASGHAQRPYLNIQPVIPISLNETWNLITRTIVPVVYREELAQGSGDELGAGDTTMSLFFSPKEAVGGWILAAGPIFLAPTGTDVAAGRREMGRGSDRAGACGRSMGGRMGCWRVTHGRSREMATGPM